MHDNIKCPSKLDCIHADTCLPDYWSGHHLPHIAVPVYNGMSITELRQQLHSEINQGAIAGSDPITQDDSGLEGDKWYRKAHAAINRIRLKDRTKRNLFPNLEVDNDENMHDSVYVYFVFQEA